MDLDGYFLFPIQVSKQNPQKKTLVLEIGKCSWKSAFIKMNLFVIEYHWLWMKNECSWMNLLINDKWG
jgi:hypothetical protein